MNRLPVNLQSPMSRLDCRVKLTLGFSISLLAVLGDSPQVLGALALVGLTLFALSRPTRFQLRLVGFSLLALAWGMVVSQGLFFNRYPRHAILILLPPNPLLPDGLKIYAEGLRYGLLQSLRMTAMGLVGYAICFSTEPDRFLRGLLALRLPFSLTFMAVTAIRFLPVAAAEFYAVRLAMRLKGYHPFRRGIRDTIRVEIAALRPVLAGAIRRSQEIALSLQTRGFSFDSPRTPATDAPLSLGSYLFIAVLILLTGAALIAKVLFKLYQFQVFYAPSLRPLYAFVRHWL